MNHTPQYRPPLPPQVHPSQCPPLQGFSRFTPGSLEGLNSVMIPTAPHEEPLQYHPHMQPFLADPRALSDQHKVRREAERERPQEGCSEGFKQSATSPNGPRFPPQLTREEKDCIQCYNNNNNNNSNNNNNNNKGVGRAVGVGGSPAPAPPPVAGPTSNRNRVMVDAATMTEPEEEETSPGWHTPNTKVAEYLTSLRQFLKLSSPTETRRKLGDVRIMTSPDGSRLYCCPQCHVAYPDKSLLEPHLATHKIERRFVCGICGAGLKRKEHLDRHQLSHTDERPYSCAACPKTFKRNEHLARHYIIHSGEKAQVCTECGKAFFRKDHLRKHAQGHLTKRLRMATMAS